MGRKPDPRELVAQVANLSQRDCEKALFAISPEALPRERDQIVSTSEEHRLELLISSELHEKLQRLKGLLAHALPDSSCAELLNHLATEALTRLEKQQGILSGGVHVPAAAGAVVKGPPPGERGYLPSAVRKQVWARSGGRCQFEVGSVRCPSRYSLELDHVTPLARGGSNGLPNLRLLCWHHNQQQALKLGPGRRASG